MIHVLKTAHQIVFRAASELLERRPSVGYLFSVATGGTGLAGLLDITTKIVGLVSVCVGLVVGLYTLRIQKRTWEKGGK